MNQFKPIDLLYVGTFPPPSGGIRVNVALLAKGLSKHPDVNFQKIDISVRGPKYRRIFTYLNRMIQIFIQARRVEIVSFSTPTNYTLLFGTLVYFIARFWGKPFVIRHGGGHNHKQHKSWGSLARTIISLGIAKADVSFFQTKAQVEYFQRIYKRKIVWFRNHRSPPLNIEIPKRHAAKKFVFLGLVVKEKGVQVMIDAFRQLGKDLSVDIIGDDRMDIESIVMNDSQINYKGAIKHDQVYETLNQYDVMLLPSFSEGQPGTLVEASLMGLPIIATSLEGIAEVVEDGKTGLLVAPRSVDELKQAIKTLSTDQELYQSMVENLLKQRELFSSDFWLDVYVNELKALR